LKNIYKELINNENITFNVIPMNPEEFPITITIPEFIKSNDVLMKKIIEENNSEQLNININSNHPISTKIIKNTEKEYRLKTGYIYHYAFIMLIGIIILLSTLSVWSVVQDTFFFDNRLLFIYGTILLFYVHSKKEA
jgi:hypothetical protein